MCKKNLNINVHVKEKHFGTDGSDYLFFRLKSEKNAAIANARNYVYIICHKKKSSFK